MKHNLYFFALCSLVILPVIYALWARVAPAPYLISLICVDIIVLWFSYRRLFRPMKVVAGGLDLLREQDFSSRLRRVGQSDADKVVDMFNDMMDRLKERNLMWLEQNEFLELLIEASPMGVLILDDDDRITSANGAARRMLGCREADLLSGLQSPLGQMLHTLDRGEVRVFRSGGKEIYRCSRLHFMDRGWPHPFILIEVLTEEVRAAERQALSRVIRTMAHEVNNSMAAIISALDTVSVILGSNSSTADMVPHVRACMERSEAMTAFIRKFAEVVRVPEPVVCLTDFKEVVDTLLPILDSICAACGADLEVDVEDAAPISIDPVLMQQVVVNVVKNAAESASEGGHVSVVASGRSLHIVDDGPGLTPEAEEHLFSGLYSSKPHGQGLGLMLVAEILHKHNAEFSLHSENDRTIFAITVPVYIKKGERAVQ